MSRWPFSDRVVKNMSSIPNTEQTSPPDPFLVEQRTSSVSYAVRCAAEPGLLARVFASLSRRGVTPTSAHADLSADGRELVINLWLAEAEPAVVARILRCLRNVRGVGSVRVSEWVSSAARSPGHFMDDPVAWVEWKVASRVASYEYLVSTGRLRRDQAIREFARLNDLQEALESLRDSDAP